DVDPIGGGEPNPMEALDDLGDRTDVEDGHADRDASGVDDLDANDRDDLDVDDGDELHPSDNDDLDANDGRESPPPARRARGGGGAQVGSGSRQKARTTWSRTSATRRAGPPGMPRSTQWASCTCSAAAIMRTSSEGSRSTKSPTRMPSRKSSTSAA